MTAGLHSVVVGDGSTPVVTVNSIGLSERMWRPQQLSCPDGVTLISYDQRGHGQSRGIPAPASIDDLVDDLLEVLEVHGIDRAVLCGLSLGGMVAMRAAETHPGRVLKLVLACTSARPGESDKWLKRARAVRARGMAAFVASSTRGWFTPQFALGHPALVGLLEDDLTATSAESYAACCDILRDLDLTGGLHRIAVPTLVVAGGADLGFPPAHAQIITSRIPDCRLEVMPAVAHLANLQDPARFDGLLWSFVEDRCRTAPDGSCT